MTHHMDQRRRIKGRGAVSNTGGRFERFLREAVDDGWGPLGDPAWGDPAWGAPAWGAPEWGEGADNGLSPGNEREPGISPPPPKVTTEITPEASRSMIARNASPDVPFDRSINPYRGCEHGCIYCFARPSHAYAGLSPGLDFETKLFAKTNAAEALTKDLSKRGYDCAPIQLGANTDPYQPIEGRLKITRSILEVLAAHKHPVTITTKSDRVVRDLDILAPMAAEGLAAVAISVTTLDDNLARALEPRAPRPQKRLDAIRQLSQAGVPVCVLTSPMIPALNDWEVERLLEAAAEAGAVGAGYTLLRLPLEIKELFREWLETHVPDRASRVLNQMRERRDGNLYVSDFGTRMKGTGVQADLLKSRFEKAARRVGLKRGSPAFRLRTDLFMPPARPSKRDDRQLNLL